jgi:FkbM family methyltransferase
MIEYIFEHDNNVKINLLSDHYKLSSYGKHFVTRSNKEVYLRKIVAYLIKGSLSEKNILDAGAWIGDNALPWAKLIQGTVYAIDPSPNNCAFINAVAKFNSIQNLYVIETALGDKDGMISTNKNIDHCEFSQLSIDHKYKVQMTSIDRLVEMGLITNLSLMHLDVEGFEYNAILGALKTIETFQPIIIYEQHMNTDKHVKDIEDILKRYGYSIYIINEVLTGCRTDCRNILALPIGHSIKSILEGVSLPSDLFIIQ